jgi:hypothetical protein
MAPIALARTFAIRCDESAVLAPQLPPSLFDRFGRRCRGKLNEKKTSAFGYARVFDLLGPSARYYHHDRSWAAWPGL